MTLRIYTHGFYSNWIIRGFQVEQRPGRCRAFVRTEPEGDFFYLTDIGGFDLPHQDGPFQITHFSHEERLLDGPHHFSHRLELAAWLSDRSTIPIPTDPRM